MTLDSYLFEIASLAAKEYGVSAIHVLSPLKDRQVVRARQLMVAATIRATGSSINWAAHAFGRNHSGLLNVMANSETEKVENIVRTVGPAPVDGSRKRVFPQCPVCGSLECQPHDEKPDWLWCIKCVDVEWGYEGDTFKVVDVRKAAS